MKNILLAIMVGLLITLTGCTTITTTPETTGEQQNTGQQIQKELDMTNKEQVMDFALNALKEENIDNLIKVSSKEGIRFSPYSYVDTGRHIILKKEELKQAYDGNTQYVRGSEDGTGDPILLTFKGYIKKYIYDLDFAQLAEKHYDYIVQRGNTINNIDDIYTGVSTIEYFIPGMNPEYGGMDRRSLTLVFQLEDKEWKLRAIVHNQRTI